MPSGPLFDASLLASLLEDCMVLIFASYAKRASGSLLSIFAPACPSWTRGERWSTTM